MTSPPIIFSEDFDLNLKPIQDSLMEKFRSFLGQNNNSNSNENNVNAQSFVNETIVEEKNHQGNQEKTNKKQDNFVIKKFKKCILDSDITLAEMLEKKTKFPNSTKKIEKTPKISKARKEKNSDSFNDKIDNSSAQIQNKNKIPAFPSDSTNDKYNERLAFISFKKVPNKVSKWNDQETDKFYNGLQRYGTDFSMISTLFANKTRIQIKNKYQREVRENPLNIEKKLTNPKQISKKTGGKLIKLDRHINQSHDNMDECFDLNAENSENQNSIPEINLEDLSILKNNSIISHDSLDHNINEQIFNIIKKETDILKKEKNLKAFI